MTYIDSPLGRRTSSALLVAVVVACGACGGTTEPEVDAEVSGVWRGSVGWYHTLEMTLAQSASDEVTGSGIRRMISSHPSKPGSLDTVATAMRIAGSVRSGQVELDIIDVELSRFLSFDVVDYEFKGFVHANNMTGTLSIVQGTSLSFGPPYSSVPPENVAFTWVRSP